MTNGEMEAPGVDRPVISVVVPILNESDAILPFIERLVPCLEQAVPSGDAAPRYEVVFVDDGSVDATLVKLIAVRQKHAGIRALVLSRNFGKDAALTAGLRYARGAAVIPIDVDLQDPPELIPEMVAKWHAGAKVVNAVRRDRSREALSKRVPAAAFYAAYNHLAERPIPANVGDFRLLDREVVNVLNALPERARFMKGLYSWVGFGVAEIAYERDTRSSGESRWTFWRLWNFALDGITSSTTTPLRVWTYCGAVLALFSFAYAAFIVVYTLINGRSVPGYASLICAVLALGGLNLIALGVVGEYVGRIFNEVKGRPLYIVSATIGFEDRADTGSPDSRD